MASVHYRASQDRWRVTWVRTNGRRGGRQFRTEEEALAFSINIPDERNGRPGPRLVAWTSAWVQAKIYRSVVIDDNGCWIWKPKGGTNKYAQIVRRTTTGLKTILMHRASYEAFVGPIPAGLEIDHLCTVTKCVNPEHLEPVIQAENLRRRDERRAVSS